MRPVDQSARTRARRWADGLVISAVVLALGSMVAPPAGFLLVAVTIAAVIRVRGAEEQDKVRLWWAIGIGATWTAVLVAVTISWVVTGQ
ncbi:hypothetical protein [Demequina aestuarii]|uniref:hypothetical protein n=1 Tax=Demequina aestuarii TaxID=327095 RepID=UPI0007825DA5|nr:hypothetical protein [Demequina aestuarii]